MSDYQDIYVIDDDIDFSLLESQQLISDRDCVAQDIIHAIRESHILERMVAERSESLQAFLIGDLRQVIESDSRVIPGSVSIDRLSGRLYLAADTDFGPIHTEFRVGHETL